MTDEPRFSKAAHVAVACLLLLSIASLFWGLSPLVAGVTAKTSHQATAAGRYKAAVATPLVVHGAIGVALAAVAAVIIGMAWALRWGKTVGIASLLAVVAIVGLVVALTGWYPYNTKMHIARPLESAADSFPVPSGAVPSLGSTDVQTHPSVDRSWTTALSLDDACTQWRLAFRSWVDAAKVGEITGEVDPGQSCSVVAKRSQYPVSLQVTNFGGTTRVLLHMSTL